MYRYDIDLEFLGGMTSEDLSQLANIIIFDPKDQKKRLTERVTTTEEYKKYGKQYKMYWKVLAAELQKYGGDSFVNTFFRQGKGVLYKEILKDAASKVVKNLDKNASVIDIEKQYVKGLLENAFEKMSEEERNAFISEIYSACLEKNLKEFADKLLEKMKEGSKKALNFIFDNLSICFSSAMKNIGSKIGIAIATSLTTIIMQIIFEASATTVAKTVAKKTVKDATVSYLMGPQAVARISVGAAGSTAGAAGGTVATIATGGFALLIFGVLLLPIFTSKALRVTIPACFVVAMLRMKYLAEQQYNELT